MQALTLQGAVAYAAANYPKILKARADVSAARRGVTLQKVREYNPTALASYQQVVATHNKLTQLIFSSPVLPPNPGPGFKNIDMSPGFFSGSGFIIDWAPIDFGLHKARIQGAKADLTVAESEYAVTQLDVVVQAAGDYLQAVVMEQQVKAAQANVDRFAEFSRVVHAQARADLRPEADASLADAQLANAQNDLIRARLQYDLAIAELANSLGVGGKRLAIDSSEIIDVAEPPDMQLGTPSFESHPLSLRGKATILREVAYKRILDKQQSTRQRDEALQQLQVNAFYIGVLFLGSLSAASYWVAYRVTLPIKESVQILKTFVADASHELNTPLTILQARLETLERRLQKLGVEEDDLKVAVSSMDRLNQVVNDLLLLSEVEDPLLTMKRKPVDVALIAGAAVEEVKDRFREKTVELSAEAMTSVIVTGNAEALHRALSNLLENALRYTNEGGKVVVRLLTTEKTVAIAVTDTGIGIPEESLPRICDRFFRVDKSRSRASGGTGLGLAIVKAVVDAHRGTLDIESKLGVGSTFTLSLPRTR